MQKQIKILLTIIMALALAVSCSKNETTDPTSTINANLTKLQQKWEYTTSAGSGYNITADKVDSYYTDNNTEQISYSVSIEEIAWYSDNASGMIYCKYTTAPSYNQGVANKYYAIAFKDLTSDTIDICGAYKSDGVSATDTLSEAKLEFTEANGYFTFNEYSKCKVIK
ncbi:hypothetical protein [Brachyspira sp. G79]|uniref:hypothetical protein n=1 Tax=Brachyspira sp. G79 TaxID=1358104 RepID=UPI000BBBBA72|nr:hypothetical protein [Brachyspira sp. G79]PCG19057.1 hypothetical protein KQ44_02590 [Brachyspira sp. G79]